MRLGAIEVRRTSTGLRITPRFKQLSEPATDSQPQNTTVEEMFEQVETDDFSMLDKLVDVALSKVNAFDFSEAAGSADEVQRNTTKLVVQARLDQVKWLVKIICHIRAIWQIRSMFSEQRSA